ncbi:MAG: hypothetical protein AAGJ31_07875, partial [Verrucomicrobiota bacterium]
GMGAIVLGFLLSAIFAIILIVKAFKTSPVWGVCSIFVPFALLVFVIKFWGEAGGSFIKYLASSVLAGAGAGVVAMSAPSTEVLLPEGEEQSSLIQWELRVS